jgi:hypothetical protein
MVEVVTIGAYGTVGEGHGGGTSLRLFVVPRAR